MTTAIETLDNEQANAPPRGRPKGSTNRKAKRNYAGELQALQGRVDMAMTLLERCTGEGTITNELVPVVKDILKGKN